MLGYTVYNIVLTAYQEVPMKYYHFPCPDQSIAALTGSILSHYGCMSVIPTLPHADRLLSSMPRNVVLLLLDGLGYDILIRHLPKSSFLIQQLSASLSSVFPPTTTAAATALETGLFPSQSGWLGWSIFWPEIGKNVALYPNTDEEGNPAAPFHIGNTALKTIPFWQQVQEQRGIPAFSVSENGDYHAGSLSELVFHIQALTNAPGPHLIYGYLNEPDHTLHREGCASARVREFLEQADRQLQNLAGSCPDTLFFLTADHGFTDVESLCLEDFPALQNTLLRAPSIEPRALNLFIKSGQEDTFLRLFSQTVGDSYTLYKKEEVLDHNLFGPGPHHPKLPEMLGDYLAVATTPLTLFPNRSYLTFMKATHGGMTPDELTVPLITWTSA